ncbi:hypothetical protein BX070DRAFT_219233 [Coemansia spiralis]|nr:hypothetical protein BX070DRAFT_219233 [Coemansia spiralis]
MLYFAKELKKKCLVRAYNNLFCSILVSNLIQCAYQAFALSAQTMMHVFGHTCLPFWFIPLIFYK